MKGDLLGGPLCIIGVHLQPNKSSVHRRCWPWSPAKVVQEKCGEPESSAVAQACGTCRLIEDGSWSALVDSHCSLLLDSVILLEELTQSLLKLGVERLVDNGPQKPVLSIKGPYSPEPGAKLQKPGTGLQGFPLLSC